VRAKKKVRTERKANCFLMDKDQGHGKGKIQDRL